MLVIVICFGLHQNLGYYTPNGTRVDNTSVISSTRDILKFTVSEKYNNRKKSEYSDCAANIVLWLEYVRHSA